MTPEEWEGLAELLRKSGKVVHEDEEGIVVDLGGLPGLVAHLETLVAELKRAVAGRGDAREVANLSYGLAQGAAVINSMAAAVVRDDQARNN